jgi:hypothetical protein
MGTLDSTLMSPRLEMAAAAAEEEAERMSGATDRHEAR